MTTPPHEQSGLPLGRQVDFPEGYAPELLAPVERALARSELGLEPGARLPFQGDDLWRAWEFGWQDLNGVPHAGVLELVVPCQSPRIAESKSLKLYLHGIACSRFSEARQVTRCIEKDLSSVCGAKVGVCLRSLREMAQQPFDGPAGESLDGLAVALPDTPPAACVPAIAPGPMRLQRWHTDLFGSLCPVTGQPDWASVSIQFEGPQIDPAALQRYLLSFRRHAGFHESCAERIFLDLWRAGSPDFLSVHCRFTRRGGIDINPYRASASVDYGAGRLVRQ